MHQGCRTTRLVRFWGWSPIWVGAALLGGCAGDPVRPLGGQDFMAEARVWSTPAAARSSAFEHARNKCNSSGGQGVDVRAEGTTHDNIGMVYRIRFQCFDRAQRAAEERARAEAAEREARRQAELRAQQERQAEIERRQREAEWERTRPQREAQERKERADREARMRREAAEREARLQRICPLYAIARQSCATAANVDVCMEIRLGRSYNYFDDRTCRNR